MRRSLTPPPSGFDARYLELTGSGARSAVELAKLFRELALEVAQVVLVHADAGGRTATEVARSYESMLARADVLREQYGEYGVKPLLAMMERAARKLVGRRVDAGGNVIRGAIVLPPKAVTLPDGTVERRPRELGPGGAITLRWGAYFEPTPDEAGTAVSAAANARAAGLVPREYAMKLVAPYFRIEDVAAAGNAIDEENAARYPDIAGDMLAGLSEGGGNEDPGALGEPPPEEQGG